MAIKRKGKTVPCEGCRERKKKCSAGQPCERCKRLGIQCYYLKSVVPPKVDSVDSVRSQELQHHVEVLDDIMRNMEREIHLLKLPLVAKQQRGNIMVTNTDAYLGTQSYDINCTAQAASMSMDNEPDSALSAAPLPIAMTVTTPSSSPSSSNWKMKINKDGTISISTDILNYANLLQHLEAFGTSLTTTTTFKVPLVKQPTLGSLSAGGGYLHRRVLSSSLRKGNFKAIIACIQSLDNLERQQKQQQLCTTTLSIKPISSFKSSLQQKGIDFATPLTPISNVSTSSSPASTAAIASIPSITTTAFTSTVYTNSALAIVATMPDLISQLVNTYFSCQFFNRVICHQKTFHDLFIRNKRRTDGLETSPVLCSMAAAVLTMHCKHVTKIVPYDQQTALGECLFEKARHLIALKFDEPSLETLTSYIFMAKYKANLLRPQEANIYLEFAIRIRQILAETVYKDPPTEILSTTTSQHQHPAHSDHNLQSPTLNTADTTSTTAHSNIPLAYTTTTPTPPPMPSQQPYFTAGSDLKFKKILKKTVSNKYIGEYETFKRLHAGLQDVVQFVQFINNERGVPVKSVSLDNARRQTSLPPPEQQRRHDLCRNSYQPIPLPDENKQTVRALMMEYFLGQLSVIVCPFFRRVRWGKDDMIPLSFLIKTEEDLTHLYHHLPLDYQLSPSIFEDGIDDEEFIKRLNEDGRCDIVSVAIAERYYQSLLAVHEPFLPVIKRFSTAPNAGSNSNLGNSNVDASTDIPLLIGEELRLQKEQQEKLDRLRAKKRKKRQAGFADSIPQSNSSKKGFFSDSSDDSDEEDSDPNSVLSVHALRAQEVCYKCAVIVIRLLEYRCTVLNSCTLPRPTLLSAWDFLLRNSCLGMSEEQLHAAKVNQFLSKKEIENSRKYALRCIDILRRGYLFNSAERDVWEHYEKLEHQLLMALGKTKTPTASYWKPLWITNN